MIWLSSLPTISINLKTYNMHTNKRLAINFFTRKCRRESENLIIYARVTHDKSRVEFSLNRELSTTLWDNNRKRGKWFSKYVQSLNKYLDQVFTQLHEAHRQLLEENKLITAGAIRARYSKEDEEVNTLRKNFAPLYNCPVIRPFYRTIQILTTEETHE